MRERWPTLYSKSSSEYTVHVHEQREGDKVYPSKFGDFDITLDQM